MSQTVLSVAIALLATLLPKFGINIGNDALTTTITTIVTVASLLWIYVRRIQVGDVNAAGVRKA